MEMEIWGKGKIKIMLNTIKNTDMKKALKLLLISGLFLSLPLFSMAQTPPHPNGGGGPGGGNTPVGGGAPIDGGLSILLLMGVAYSSKKVYKAFK
jgi:hypothetical protein